MRDILFASAALAALAGGGWLLAGPAAMTAEAGTSAATPAAQTAAVETPATASAPVALAGPPLPLARPSARDLAQRDLARLLRGDAASVRVVNAGTLQVGETVHVLHGLDAPAVNQTCRAPSGGVWACGEDARRAVASFVRGRSVTCEAASPGAITSRCTAGGQDVASWIVSQGWAVADAEMQGDLGLQTAAKAEGKGLWSSWFETPSVWRARNAVEDDLRLVLTEDDGRA